MFEDKSQISNTNEWYQKVQMCRRVPPRLSPIDRYDKPECYALSLRNAQLPGLKMDMSYRIHAYFYDKQRKYYFGKPFCGRWCRSGSDSILFTEVIFFWCPFTDNIDIVMELVEGEQKGENWSRLYTAAWTLLSLGNEENSTAFHRLPLYPGSPKALFFMASEVEMAELSRRANIGLEICLQTYQKMYDVLDFIPEWYMFDQWEDIPGLQTSYDDESQAALPEALKGRTFLLSEINLSFGMDVYKFEQILLHLMNNDRLYRANRSPADINVKMMEVLERRITIGVHNGLCYVEKPQCLHLSSTENQICSTSKMRRNKLTTKSNLTSQSRSLFMNGSVILNRMIADPHFAITFSLDYLVGVYSCDGTVHSSQSVMVCWGAWCPFAVDIVPDGEITVPLVGGPNINPDERLAFKNSLAFRSDLPFCNQLPRTEITFMCSGLGEVGQLLNTSSRINNEPNMETIRHQVNSTNAAQNSEREEKFVGKVSSNDERECDTDTSVKIYSLPLVSAANISRAPLTVFADIPFTPIKDRNGNKPKVVDIENFPAPDTNIELNDKLNTNETIIQFLAIKISCGENDYIKTPTAVFFTIDFYRFYTVTTERLWLDIVHAKTSLREQLFVLNRRGNIDEIAKEDCNGFTVRYMVDGNSLADGDKEDYIDYLSNGHAIVDVWDADSLLPLGKTYIPLKSLLRHGSEAVQADIQSAVVLSFPESSIITCQVLLRLANIGHPCLKQIDSMQSRTSAVVSQQLTRIGQNGYESYKIRAKPLNPIHENSLQRFLAAQRLDIDQRYNEIMNGVLLGAKNQNQVMRPLTTKQELEAYKKLRAEDKASKLLKVVFNAITTEYRYELASILKK
uniref:Transcription initiation factor TFIID subunit 2 n=1 Tax=Loa loa TaxID=7209 RepID=A0A1I7VUK3_LOALO